MLVADAGFNGLALVIEGPREISFVEDDPRVAVGGGAPLQALVTECIKANLGGIEWMIGIPGTMGGSIAMNAGCHGSEARHVTNNADVFDLRTGEIVKWSNDRLAFGFRRSALKNHHVVVGASLQLFERPRSESSALVDEYRRYRRDHHPDGRNAGSVFTNDRAYALIQAAGAASLSFGCARVAKSHSNWIQVNSRGSTRASDVFEIMCGMKEAVWERLGVHLRSCGLEVDSEPLPDRFLHSAHYLKTSEHPRRPPGVDLDVGVTFGHSGASEAQTSPRRCLD